MHDGEIPDMLIGTVAGLWRYPVKSLAAQALSDVCIEADGIAGDRCAALIVASPDHARTGKPFRGKEHRRLHTVATPPQAQAFGAAAGVQLELHAGARYFDAQSVSIVWDTWLHDVEALVERPLDPLRYRPNIFVRAAPGFHTREEAFVGATIAAGAVVLRVVAPIKRCVTTTYDIATGDSDPAVLREVAQHRGNTVGVYCAVERSGRLACGDPVEQR